MNFRISVLDKPARFLLAVILIFLSLNHFFSFFPQLIISENALLLIHALKKTGFILHLYAGIQFISAMLFLFNRYVTFGSLILLPGSINFLLFNLFLDRSGLIIATLILSLLGIIIFYRIDNYRSFFKP